MALLPEQGSVKLDQQKCLRHQVAGTAQRLDPAYNEFFDGLLMVFLDVTKDFFHH